MNNAKKKASPANPKDAQRMMDLLSSVLSRPTAPFRESWVVGSLKVQCQNRGISLFEDEFGNLWANARHLDDVKKSRLVFVAHMDHPGFIVTGFRVSTGRKPKVIADAKWLGGGPMKIVGHSVKVFSHFHGLLCFDGVIRKTTPGTRSVATAEIEITSDFASFDYFSGAGFKNLGPWGACLWYGQDPVVFQDGRVITKAADDLVGISALIEGLTRAKAKPGNGVTCLFSRAEECGFHGTIAALEKGWLDPKKTVMVSVETSSALPGAEVGKGPVVRLGDRSTVFDPGLVKWVQDKAAKLAGGPAGFMNRETKFSFQRRVMDGGSCEASAFNAYGYTVAGVSVPLASYHNLGEHGAAAPEEVSFSDVLRTSDLVSELMKSARDLDLSRLRKNAFEKFYTDIVKNFREHRHYFNG